MDFFFGNEINNFFKIPKSPKKSKPKSGCHLRRSKNFWTRRLTKKFLDLEVAKKKNPAPKKKLFLLFFFHFIFSCQIYSNITFSFLAFARVVNGPRWLITNLFMVFGISPFNGRSISQKSTVLDLSVLFST